MKKLTQAIFDGAPDWVMSAAVDENGMTYWYGCPASDLFVIDDWWDWKPGHKSKYIGDTHVSDWQNSAIDREVDNKNQPQEPYFLMKGDLFYRHSYRGYSDFSAWAGVYDKDEAIAYAEKSGGSVIAKPARNFYHEPEEIDRMIERLQLIRQALRDSPNGY